MPTPYIEKLSKQGKGTVQGLERKWEDAKAQAAKQGQGNNYAYVTEIFNNMIGASLQIQASRRLRNPIGETGD